MTEKNEETAFKLRNFFQLTSEQKAQDFDKVTISEDKVHLMLCEDYNIFHEATLLLKPEIQAIMATNYNFFYSTQAQILMTMELDPKFEKTGEEVIEVVKKLYKNINNMLTELTELTSNPETTFKDKHKVTKIIELDNLIAVNNQQFLDFIQETLEKTMKYITNPEKIREITGDHAETVLEKLKQLQRKDIH